MKQQKYIYLSYTLNEQTPTYGDRNQFTMLKTSEIAQGNVANDTFIKTTVHIGTHIDFPYHFYDNGQTIEDFDNPTFWCFSKEEVLIVELEMDDTLIIESSLVTALEQLQQRKSLKDVRLLIVKTGICHFRNTEKFWKNNYGFHPSLASFLRKNCPKLVIFGFDSISVSSFQYRILGREAHRAFLDPKHPILLLEDMNLVDINAKTVFSEIVVTPLRIQNCDAAPCTIVGKIDV